MWFERFGQVSHLAGTDAKLAAERGGNVDDPNKDDRSTSSSGSPRPRTSRRGGSLWGPAAPAGVECSALATGAGHHHRPPRRGADLIYPHHECEAAQSEAATGEPFVRHWMHQAMVRYRGEKMSKSLGNLVFVSDLRREWDPRAIRLAVLAHHYRVEWEWDDAVMPAAAERLERWQAASRGDGDAALDAVRAALDDDLDTPAALAAIDEAAAGSDVTAAAAQASSCASTRRPDPGGW